MKKSYNKKYKSTQLVLKHSLSLPKIFLVYYNTTHIHIVTEAEALGAVLRKMRQMKRICPSSNSLPNASVTLPKKRKKKKKKRRELGKRRDIIFIFSNAQFFFFGGGGPNYNIHMENSDCFLKAKIKYDSEIKSQKIKS